MVAALPDVQNLSITKDYSLPERDLLIMDALPWNVLTLENRSVMPFAVVIVQPSQSPKSKLGL